MFTVYALYNASSRRIYIGQTDNLERRIAEHNKKMGNHFTARFQGEWVLIYQEEVSSRSDALRREKQLKSAQGRTFVKLHIPE